MRQALRTTTNSPNFITRDLTNRLLSQCQCQASNLNSNQYSTSTVISPDLLDEKFYNMAYSNKSSNSLPSLFSRSNSNASISSSRASLSRSSSTSSTSSTISQAQFERYKDNSNKISNLISSNSSSHSIASSNNGINFLLAQRLEKLTSKYNCSVPVIISSWLKNDASNSSIKVKLTDEDINYLNEVHVI